MAAGLKSRPRSYPIEADYALLLSRQECGLDLSGSIVNKSADAEFMIEVGPHFLRAN